MNTTRPFEYPFVGIPPDAGLAYDIRWNVIRANCRLEYEQVLRLLAVQKEPSFVPMLLHSQLNMHPALQTEVFQSIIELAGGLNPIRGRLLIEALGCEIRGDRSRRYWEEKPLLLLPPKDSLQDIDPGLFRRSYTLFQYVHAGARIFAEHWGAASKRPLPDVHGATEYVNQT